MKLKLVRRWFTDKSTIGRLYIDDEAICYTLEDVVRADGVKVFGQTAIPYGTYSVVVSYSPRFDRQLPLISNVPGFSGIRIHSGNKSEDTEGCVLVGMSYNPDNPDYIMDSRTALTTVLGKMKYQKDISIEITHE